MKSKTSKYLAALIIILGVVFIYFIPQIFKNSNCKACPRLNVPVTQKVKVVLNSLITEKVKFSDDEFQDAFNQAEVLILVKNIKLVDGNKMYGDIVGIINKHNIPLRYKVGYNEFVDNTPPNPPDGLATPDGAVLFLKTGSNYMKNANKWYFNSGVLSNGYTFEYMSEVFEKYNSGK